MTSSPMTLAAQAEALASGRTRARSLADHALALIDAQAKNGVPAFIHFDPAGVRGAADESDARRKQGRALSAFDGVPFGVKDLFDVAGEVTTAGSVALKGAAPAGADADAVARLRRLGFIPLGRTNMTEFAYSGLGLNPHYGTPPSVYRSNGLRIPGGSSSGSAVAVASGVCSVALGTDTGGSCRIPAAFNGIAGFKPTAARVSKRGAYPLSERFDSVGPLAASAACCATLDGILADGLAAAVAPHQPRLAVITTYLLDDLAPEVAADFARARRALEAAGWDIEDVAFAALADIPPLLKNGGIVGYEASRLHGALMDEKGGAYDPRVISRIRMGLDTSDVDFAALLARRAAMIAAFETLMSGYHGVLSPTVPMPPPLMTAFPDDAEYRRLNGLALRNTYVFNFLNGCSGSIPMHATGAAPTGLMLSGTGGSDGAVLGLCVAAEQILAARRS